MVVKCPYCYSKHVSKCEDSGVKWQCDKCKRKFNQSAFDIDDEFEKFGEISIERKERERKERERKEREKIEKKRKERIEREKKGIYLEKSLDLLNNSSFDILQIVFDKFAISKFMSNSEKVKYTAHNYPTKDIEIAIKEAKDQKIRERTKKERIEKERKEREKIEKERKERIERERKGIYLEKSLDLLNKCSSDILQIVFDKFVISTYIHKSEKVKYTAHNYPTKDIEIAIKEAKDQKIREKAKIERIEKERKERIEREKKDKEEKGIYVEKSLDLMNNYTADVLQIVFKKFNVSDSISMTQKVKYTAHNYPTKDIENEIIKAEKQIEREKLERLERERKFSKDSSITLSTNSVSTKSSDINDKNYESFNETEETNHNENFKKFCLLMIVLFLLVICANRIIILLYG